MLWETEINPLIKLCIKYYFIYLKYHKNKVFNIGSNVFGNIRMLELLTYGGWNCQSLGTRDYSCQGNLAQIFFCADSLGLEKYANAKNKIPKKGQTCRTHIKNSKITSQKKQSSKMRVFSLFFHLKRLER